jgi:hypothetical protein
MRVILNLLTAGLGIALTMGTALAADVPHAIEGTCWIEEPERWISAPPELGYRSDNAAVAILVLAPDGRCALLDATVIRTDRTRFIDRGSGYAVYVGEIDRSAEQGKIKLVRTATTGRARMPDGNFLPPRFPPESPISWSDVRIQIGDYAFVRLPREAVDLRENLAALVEKLTGVRVGCKYSVHEESVYRISETERSEADQRN